MQQASKAKQLVEKLSVYSSHPECQKFLPAFTQEMEEYNRTFAQVTRLSDN